RRGTEVWALDISCLWALGFRLWLVAGSWQLAAGHWQHSAATYHPSLLSTCPECVQNRPLGRVHEHLTPAEVASPAGAAVAEILQVYDRVVGRAVVGATHAAGGVGFLIVHRALPVESERQAVQ